LNALFALLHVKPDERRRVGILALYSMVAVGGVVITGGLAGRALFLSQLPRDVIALKFLLPPIALAASIGVYARVMGRARLDRLIVATSIASAAAALLLRAGLSSPAGDGLVFLSALFVAIEVISALVMIQLWTIAADVFDTRQAKRLFAPIAAGGTLAAVVFSLGLAAAARSVPPENLLFCFAGSLLVCGACALRLGPHLGAGAGLNSPGADRDAADWRGILQHPLVGATAGVVVAGAVASAIADYQLDLALQDHYGADAQGMVAFLGLLRGGAGIVALILQVFVAGRLLQRLGLRGGLLALPVLMLFGQAAIVVTGGLLFAAALPRAADGALKFDLNNTSVSLLSMPVPSADRARAKVAIDGIIKPAILSLTGGAFLLAGLVPGITVVHWAVPAVGVGVLWLHFVKRAADSYVEELRSGLRQRRLGGTAAPISVDDETSRQALSDALASPDDALVLQALAVLEEASEGSGLLDLRPLLTHSVVDIRSRALELLSRTADPALLPDLQALLEHDPSPRVRGAALLALTATMGPSAAPQVIPLLEDPNPELRAGAVRAALLHLGLEGVLHAAAVLKGLFDSPDADLRAQGARVLGELGARSFYAPLETLIEDPELAVRRAAIMAAGQLGAPGMINALVRHIADPRLARDAQQALAACLDGAVRPIVERVADPSTPPMQRIGLVKALAHVGAPAQGPLEGLLQNEDGRTRGAAARSLRLSAREVDGPMLTAAIALEGTAAFSLARLISALSGEGAQVRAALCDRLEEVRSRVLDLLALGHPDLPVDVVRDSLRSANGRARANALELLDNVLEPAGRPTLLALAELDVDRLTALDVSRPRGEVVDAHAVLERLAASADPWLRACALFDLGEQGQGGGQLVQGAIDDDDPLVAETARSAALRAHGAQDEKAQTMAMTTLEKVLFLKSIPLFEGLAGETVAQVAPIAREVRHRKGETFIRAGDRGDCLFVVVDGEVEIRTPDADVFEEGSRAILGELAVLTHRPRNADCVASSDLLMLRIGKEDFWALLEERPELSTRILRQIIDRYL
jgi:HEAT repeat protein